MLEALSLASLIDLCLAVLQTLHSRLPGVQIHLRKRPDAGQVDGRCVEVSMNCSASGFVQRLMEFSGRGFMWFFTGRTLAVEDKDVPLISPDFDWHIGLALGQLATTLGKRIAARIHVTDST